MDPPASPSVRPPPVPASNITRKDKNIGDPIGGSEARWTVTGRSTSHWKFPISPLAMVGEMSGKTWAAKRKMSATKTAAARVSGRRHAPQSQVSSNGAGGEDHSEGTNLEESADESEYLSFKDTEGSAIDEEAETAVWGGGGSARNGRRRHGEHKEVEQDHYMGAQRPAGATSGRSPLQPRKRRDQEAAMGRDQGQRRGLPDGGKT